MAQLLLNTRAVRILLEIITHEVDRGMRIRLPADRAAQRILIAPVDAVPVVEIFGIAVPLQIGARKADTERRGERQIEHPLRPPGIVIAILQRGGRMNARQIGFRRHEADDPAGCVATEQGALRPAQHLDPLKIEIVGLEQARRHQWHLVDRDPHRCVATGGDRGVADAANGEVRAGELALGEGHARDRQIKIGCRPDLLPLKRRRIEGGDRDRHVLETLRTSLRRNDDIAYAVARPDLRNWRLRLLRSCGMTDGERRNSGRHGEGDSGELAHAVSPLLRRRSSCTGVIDPPR